MTRQENLRIQAEQVEQARLAQEQAQQAQEEARLEQERKNNALGKVEDLKKILKAKNEKNKLKKQKEAEEERLRLEQEKLQAEQDDDADYEQLFNDNPHSFSNKDVITDGNNNYEVNGNDAYKINPKSRTVSESVKIEYVVNSDNTFLWVNKSGKRVNVSLVSSASITPTPTAIKSKWPFDVDIPEDGETFRRYGDYLFRVDPTNNKLKEYPRYLIQSDDSISKLTKNDADYNTGHNNHKQEIKDYNASLGGAGLKRNIGCFGSFRGLL